MTVKIIGLSGPSSSGKTTLALAYILQRILPNVIYILHADDFCKEFDHIPTVNGHLDYNGPDAVDFMRMGEVLDHMKSHDGNSLSGFQKLVGSGASWPRGESAEGCAGKIG